MQQKNPFILDGIIEVDSDNLFFGERLAARNKKTLEQIDAGVPIRELEYFKEPKNRGEHISGYESTQIFVDLYKSIKKKGFVDEPYLNIEIKPYGQYRMRRGRHRLSILHHLGNRKIKVRIGLIDNEFSKICDKIFKMNKWRGGKIYNKVMNPLFKHIPTYGSQERINIISDCYDFKGKTVLDIGSRMGYNSHIPARHGAKVIGIDCAAGWKEIADYLTKMYSIRWDCNLNVEFLVGDIYDYVSGQLSAVGGFQSIVGSQHFDVILFLSVFHHLVVGNADRAYKLLDRLSEMCDVMFFDAGTQWKRQFDIEHEGKEIVRRTGFKKWKLIGKKGELDLRRDLWMLSK